MNSNLLVLFLCGATLSNPISLQRRQFPSYTTNILHENPNFPDQTAQSSVSFSQNQFYQPELAQAYTQNYPTTAPQSQLFNVGYSVRFTNGEKPQPKRARSNLDDGEIITGTKKQNEQVQVPDFSPLAATKKQKILGIKPKASFGGSFQNPKLLLNQANLAPTTQKFYKALEQVKPQIQNTQELQQKYSWRNLSPGVEIIRSTEVPIVQKYTKIEPTLNFDHGRALGRSEEFDFSNALDSKNQNLYKVNEPQIPIVVGQKIAKVPLDTSLLREQVPIQVDTRFLEEAMRQNIYNQKVAESQQQPEFKYLQVYRGVPENPQKMVYRQEPQPQVFQDFDQNRFQYKVYGKPQPLVGYNGQEELKRQPRYLNDLHTNLRPPPFDFSYQRRFRLY